MMVARPILRQPVALANVGLWLIGALALTYLSLQILSAWMSGLFAGTERTIPGQTIALAALVYMTGHLFRSMRLALLIGGWSVGLRLITSFHFATAGVSLAMPLKLGEFFRIAALSRLAGNITRAIEIVWWERLLDVVALIAIMLIALRDVTGSRWQEFSGVIAISVAFVAISVLAFFVLPDNLRRTSILIIRRYRGAHTIPVLQALERARCAIIEAPRMVRTKIGSLAALTFLIWACEIGTFAIVLRGMGQVIADAPDALLKLLSFLARGQTLADALQNHQSLDRGFLPYLTATQVPLILVAVIAGIVFTMYWRRR
jgi:hypothetical protein